MKNAVAVQAKTPLKSVTLHLNEEIDKWLEEQALLRDLSKARIGREVFEKAMRESEAEETKESAA